MLICFTKAREERDNAEAVFPIPKTMGSLAAPATSTPPLSFSRLHMASPAGLFDRRRGARGISPARLRTVGAVAYMERNPNSMSAFASKVIGSLPVVGLLARIFNEEGGVGDDLIDFAEFRRRVGKKCSITDSRAFIEFKDRRGVTGDPFYVLLCCWLAAIGAGLLKSEEIFEGVARLRISKDIEFEEVTFLSNMKAAREMEIVPRMPGNPLGSVACIDLTMLDNSFTMGSLKRTTPSSKMRFDICGGLLPEVTIGLGVRGVLKFLSMMSTSSRCSSIRRTRSSTDVGASTLP